MGTDGTFFVERQDPGDERWVCARSPSAAVRSQGRDASLWEVGRPYGLFVALGGRDIGGRVPWGEIEPLIPTRGMPPDPAPELVPYLRMPPRPVPHVYGHSWLLASEFSRLDFSRLVRSRQPSALRDETPLVLTFETLIGVEWILHVMSALDDIAGGGDARLTYWFDC